MARPDGVSGTTFAVSAACYLQLQYSIGFTGLRESLRLDQEEGACPSLLKSASEHGRRWHGQTKEPLPGRQPLYRQYKTEKYDYRNR